MADASVPSATGLGAARALGRGGWLVWSALLLAAVFAWLATLPPAPEPPGADRDRVLAGAVTRVRDGDTVEVAGRAVRLAGVSCEERGTPGGQRASRAARRLVEGRQLTCALDGMRSYDRLVGRCALPDGRDLGAALIAGGSCRRCDRFDPAGLYAGLAAAGPGEAGVLPGYCRTGARPA